MELQGYYQDIFLRHCALPGIGCNKGTVIGYNTVSSQAFDYGVSSLDCGTGTVCSLDCSADSTSDYESASPATSPEPWSLEPLAEADLSRLLPPAGEPESMGTKARGGRRAKANARERRRMLRINTAFGQLRRAVPGGPGHRELSKMEALAAARSYILALAALLHQPAL
jgi:hypothetical protein